MISIIHKFLQKMRVKALRRKIVYSIVSLLVIISISKYIMQWTIDYWLIKKIDQYSIEKYGVNAKLQQIEIHPWQGQIVLHDLAIGQDLAKVGICKIKLKLTSLLSVPRIENITIKDINLNINHDNWSSIKLTKRSHHKHIHRFYLNRLEVINGKANIDESILGIPKCHFTFQALGKGRFANQLALELKIPKITLSKNNKTFNGNLSIISNITDDNLTISKSYLQINNNNLGCNGNFHYKSRKLDLDVDGHLDLAQVQAFLSATKPNLMSVLGCVDFKFGTSGCIDDLYWQSNIKGKQLKINGLAQQTGDMVASLSGQGTNVRLDKLSWVSGGSKLAAKGNLLSKNGCDLYIEANNNAMTGVASLTHAHFLNNVVVDYSGRIKLPVRLLDKKLVLPELRQCVFNGIGKLSQNGKKIGDLMLALKNREVKAAINNLDLVELNGWGEISGTINKHGFDRINGSAKLATDASDVADMLAAWHIGKKNQNGHLTPLDMSGKTQVQATFNWDHNNGFRLNGSGVIDAPRWHMTHGDQIRTNINIDKKVLRLTEMALDKGNGKAYGQLWLTWAKLLAGSEQIDMQYHVCELPIQEGLRAADIDNLAIDGNFSGWIRLHGPFKQIKAESQIDVKQANIFGLKIPSACTQLYLDIANGHLKMPDIRIYDNTNYVDVSTTMPIDLFDISGAIDMNYKTKTWLVALNGIIDSNTLGLKGPHVKAKTDIYLDGFFFSPLGPIKAPTGHIKITDGTLYKEDGDIKNLEGSIDVNDGKLLAWLGFAGNITRLFQIDAMQTGYDQLDWNAKFKLESKSLNISNIIKSFSNNILKDANVEFCANGNWNADGCQWQGQVKQLEGKFHGFNIVQIYPGTLVGNNRVADINIALKGTADIHSFKGDLPVDKGSKIELDKVLANSAHDEPNIHINGRLPLSLNDALALNVTGSTNLVNLKIILDKVIQLGQHSALANLSAQGNADFDIHLSGAINDAFIDGTLALNDGKVTISNYPIGINNLNFTAKFCGRDIIISEDTPLYGTIAQGAVLAWGKATWHPRGVLSYNLHTKLTDFQLADVSNCFELQGDLAANLVGNDRDGGLLSGDIWTKQNMYRTNISLTDLIANNIVGSINVATSSAPKIDLLSKIALALSIHTLEPLEIDTNFLKMRWQPAESLLVEGSIYQPMLKGRVKLLPGGLLTNIFPTGDINLEEGTIDFNNSILFNPNINIKGRINISPYTVTLSLAGSMNSLQFQALSVPSLRQDQILAILLDPMKAVEIGSELSSIASTNTISDLSTNLFTTLALSDFQEKLRSILNLDRVSISFQNMAEDPAVMITLGKNFTIFNHTIPFIFKHKRVDNATSSSGSIEWHRSNLTICIGISDKDNSRDQTVKENGVTPFVKIHYTWSPK